MRADLGLSSSSSLSLVTVLPILAYLGTDPADHGPSLTIAVFAPHSKRGRTPHTSHRLFCSLPFDSLEIEQHLFPLHLLAPTNFTAFEVINPLKPQVK